MLITSLHRLQPVERNLFNFIPGILFELSHDLAFESLQLRSGYRNDKHYHYTSLAGCNDLQRLQIPN